VSAERAGRNRVRHGVMGEFSDARRLTSAGFVGAPEFYPSAPPVNGLRQPIREIRRGQGQVHGQSISDETVGYRCPHSVVSVAAISGLIAALS
jgi:hypothetical protein